ncbi:DUF6491 family protein [Psychrobium sp. 1_MG-2023]|uniref:DUF6491 family protein n=1 Tax=Psychrobium sp. 1_MG-2023 TaxID=3062624 RepID=UPI000C33571D|nr:DUF6491 family protein [Psychrobium sp. 1_MG-2023]MDP2560668.1 DUF6491 family protein [Psychrobium sp. 1_MG-2023]PKF56564.1 hypothetical protein CW748_08750 [Alteromonadales bacterium alter-6D02]
MNKVITVLVVLMIVGCANQPSLSTSEKNAQYAQFIVENKLESLDKIKGFRFNSWQSLTDDYLIISTSPKQKYLLQVNGYCPDLTFSHSIILHQGMSSMLSAKFDSVSTTEQPQFKCFIKTIHKLDKQQSKTLSAIGKPMVDKAK